MCILSNPLDIVIVDCEASGIHPDSYPIQIAWYHPKTDTKRSYLIKPKEEWTFWDENAENVHGIARFDLYTSGLDWEEVIKKLNSDPLFVNAHRLVSDAPKFDMFWIERLYEDEEYINNGVKTQLPRMVNFIDLFEDEVDKIAMYKCLRSQIRSHDALDDCLKMYEAYQYVLDTM